MHTFLVEPTPPQRKYLASVSQGYFLYHLLGLNPSFTKVSHEIFQKTLWLCDSSVILPLIAVGCHNHDYAKDLFNTLNDANAMVLTTPKLLKEALEHFEWALRFMERTGTESSELLRAAILKGSYKQNLFVDGYIRLSADGQVGSFRDYLDRIISNGRIDVNSFEEKVKQVGVNIAVISELEGFHQNDWNEIDLAKEKIKKVRKDRGIYRSELQVEAEAVVWVLIKYLRSGKYVIDGLEQLENVYFVSQSRIIDQVFQMNDIATWTPEALYRYISTLPGRETSPELLQQCMLHEYFYAGISFIDKDRYIRFFGPSIDAAKASFEIEKSNYIDEVEGTYTRNIDDAFERTPDLEKPFFVAQMGWRRAEAAKKQEELAKERALEAEAKVKKLESEKMDAWRTRAKRKKEHEEARQRNLQDPKHLRKRIKQAKKRKRKKK